MCTYFKTETDEKKKTKKTETDATRNLIDDFLFLTLAVRRPFHRKNFK